MRRLKKCPHCGKSQLQRLMSAPVFRLKGGGWYETDFKSDQDNKRNLADRPEADAPKEDKKETTEAASKDAAAPGAAQPAEKAAEKPAEKAASEAQKPAGVAGSRRVSPSAAKSKAKTPPQASGKSGGAQEERGEAGAPALSLGACPRGLASLSIARFPFAVRSLCALIIAARSTSH